MKSSDKENIYLVQKGKWKTFSQTNQAYAKEKRMENVLYFCLNKLPTKRVSASVPCYELALEFLFFLSKSPSALAD